MFSSSKKREKLFLTNDTKVNKSDVEFEVIVSPELYWVREFEIPVKNAKKALEVLPTMFEDVIEGDVSKLSYQAKQIKENAFLAFAYESEMIQQALKSANISFNNVANLYFAQNECEHIQSFESNGKHFWYTEDGILVKVPSVLAKESVKLEDQIERIELSSFKVNMRFYSSVISNKIYYSLLLIFAVLSITNIIKYSIYSSEITDLNRSTQTIKEINSLPTSTLQINSIFKNYEKTILNEKKKREAIAYISSNKKFDLKTITLKNNEIELEYLSANKGSVENFLRKKFKTVSSTQGGFFLKVRVKI